MSTQPLTSPNPNPILVSDDWLLEIEPNKADPAEIRKTVKALFCPGDLMELRAINRDGFVGSGLYTDQDKYMAEICALSDNPNVEAVWWNLNAISAEKKPRDFGWGAPGVKNEDITHRHYILCDADPSRAAGFENDSTTEEEKKLARADALRLLDLLKQYNIPAHTADSGNGFHALVPVDVPANDETDRLVADFLAALNLILKPTAAKIDEAVKNRARVCKIYGTQTRRGRHLPDRPWRVSKLRTTTNQIASVENLKRLIAAAPQPEPLKPAFPSAVPAESAVPEQTHITPEMLYSELLDKGVQISKEFTLGGNPTWGVRCPFAEHHDASRAPKKTIVFLTSTGPRFHCFADKCASYGWREYRAQIEQQSGRKFVFRTKLDEATIPDYEVPAISETPPERPAPISRIKPIGEAALYGLLGEFVQRQLPETEANAPNLLFQALALAGNFLGPNPYFRVRSTKHRTNLYACLVGPTSCAKGEGKDCVDALLQTADPEWRGITGLNSNEGIAAIAKDEENPDQIKTLCFDESEFARLLEACYRQGSTLGHGLRMGWDDVAFDIVTKTNSIMGAKAMITLTGHITPRELLDTLSDADFSNGFANRILWVCVESSKDVPDAGKEIDWNDLAGRLKQAKAVADCIGEMDFDSEARDLWNSVYGQLKKRPDGIFGKVTARARPNVKRMAMIYALLPPAELVVGTTPLELQRARKIGLKPLQAALEAWRFAEDSARLIFEGLSTDDGKDVLRCKVEANRRYGKIRASELATLFSHKTAEDREAIAVQAGLRKQREQTKGRPVDVWVWR